MTTEPESIPSEDQFCSRCGQRFPDDTERQVEESVTELRKQIGRQLCEHARHRFALVGEIRAKLALMHPRVRRVEGRDLRPGWFFCDTKEGSFGRRSIWYVVVALDPDKHRLDYMGVDPTGGTNVYTGTRGLEGSFGVDDLEVPRFQEPT